MAGDWIKFEIATSDKAEVWGIADALDLDPDAVVGKLLRVWTWFDQHTEKGNAPIVTKKLLDRLVNVSGFCDQMILVDWMISDEKTISLPNFDHHNGKTAKNRAVTAKRVAKHKKSNANNNDKVTQSPLPSALPKEEKRREDIKTKQKKPKFDYEKHFIEFWEAWPKQGDTRKTALDKFKVKCKSESDFVLITQGLNKFIPYYQTQPNKFIPSASTWLNQERWNDDVPEVFSKGDEDSARQAKIAQFAQMGNQSGVVSEQ